MKNAPVRWVCALAFVAAVACGGGEATSEMPPAASPTTGAEPEPAAAPEPVAEAAPEPAEEPATPAANVAKPEASPPRYGAFITEVVKDYDAWKEAFDDAEDKRKEAGIVGHMVLLHPKAKAKVSLVLRARDADPLEAYLESDDLKQLNKDSGVKGKPSVVVLSLVEDNLNQDLGDMFSAMIKNKVADFDAWKEAFDEHASARDDAGLFGSSVATAMNDDHIVYVYLQAREQEALDKFLASKDLKDAMKAAGVKDTPEITKLTEEESRDY